MDDVSERAELVRRRLLAQFMDPARAKQLAKGATKVTPEEARRDYKQNMGA